MVTEWRHRLHQTLENNRFLISAEMFDQSLAALGVNGVEESTGMGSSLAPACIQQMGRLLAS